MFNQLTLFIGWRYARSRSKNKFIQFISASSVTGIALGSCVLIWVLSAMNGFEEQLKLRLLSVVPHIEYISVEKTGLENWQPIAEQINERPEVLGVAPFISFGGLIQKGIKLHPIEIRGIDWQFEQSVSQIADYLTPESITQFKTQDGILLGKGIAESLNLELGQFIDILVPRHGKNGKLVSPNLIRMELLGTFKTGSQLDHGLGYIQLDRAAQAAGWHNGIQGLRLKVDDVFNARYIAQQIGFQLPFYVYIQDWTRQFGHVYNDIQLVRSIMYLILALVVAVACFNIVSTLVMAVNEKQSDIAILKTLGMPASDMIKIFILKGLYSGLLGVFIGVVLGVAGALWLSDLMVLVESLIGIKFLSGEIYFIDFLPSKLIWQDVVITASVALIMSVLATLYPAYKASKVDPAKVIGKL